jgi:hypothetical protein
MKDTLKLDSVPDGFISVKLIGFGLFLGGGGSENRFKARWMLCMPSNNWQTNFLLLHSAWF